MSGMTFFDAFACRSLKRLSFVNLVPVMPVGEKSISDKDGLCVTV